jgi:hypothetical protein
MRVILPPVLETVETDPSCPPIVPSIRRIRKIAIITYWPTRLLHWLRPAAHTRTTIKIFYIRLPRTPSGLTYHCNHTRIASISRVNISSYRVAMPTRGKSRKILIKASISGRLIISSVCMQMRNIIKLSVEFMPIYGSCVDSTNIGVIGSTY